MRALEVKEMQKKEAAEIKTTKLDLACMRYGVGKNTMRLIAKNAGAVVRIGKSYLINVTKVDNYLDAMSGE